MDNVLSSTTVILCKLLVHNYPMLLLCCLKTWIIISIPSRHSCKRTNLTKNNVPNAKEGFTVPHCTGPGYWPTVVCHGCLPLSCHIYWPTMILHGYPPSCRMHCLLVVKMLCCMIWEWSNYILLCTPMTKCP